MANKRGSFNTGNNDWVHLAAGIWILGILSFLGYFLNFGKSLSVIVIIAGLFVHAMAYISTH
ncbi:MAG: hypothetical protein ACYCUZ_05615 [Cuniculiplasma sp.]